MSVPLNPAHKFIPPDRSIMGPPLTLSRGSLRNIMTVTTPVGMNTVHKIPPKRIEDTPPPPELPPIIIKHPEVIQFFQNNSSIDIEKFFLHTIREYTPGNEKKITITSAELAKIYQEHQTLENFKKHFMPLLNDFTKETKAHMVKVKFHELENLICRNLNVQFDTFTCPHCPFTCATKKGIVTHSRKCGRIMQSTPDDTGDIDDYDADET